MTDELDSEIKLTLSTISVNRFLGLGEWSDFLNGNYPDEVRSIFKREEASIDTSNIRDLDRYLLNSRYFMRNTESYKSLLHKGIRVCMESHDESLLETISIILGKRILEYEQLFNLATEKSKTNAQIHRVLYNNLREEVPDVRGYVGSGATVPPN